MRVIKLAVISFIVLFGILTGFSLFIPSHIRMSKVISVTGERDSILFLLKNKEQWPRWHPVFMPSNDPQQKFLQQTRFTIISQSDSSLAMQLRQDAKKPFNTGWQLHSSSLPGFSTLEWYTDFRFSWLPWQKFSSLFLEKTHGAMMEKGLYNIKQVVESKKESL